MDSVAVEVADTGVGIPRVHLEKIFEPFFTTRADSGGTGLGLGLCRMLISEMGGRIEVRSTVGRGNRLHRRSQSRRRISRRLCAHMRILVADDEKIKRVTLAHDLAAQGHEVVTAADGAEALEKLESRAASTSS